jgi:hypothetical protein
MDNQRESAPRLTCSVQVVDFTWAGFLGMTRIFCTSSGAREQLFLALLCRMLRRSLWRFSGEIEAD